MNPSTPALQLIVRDSKSIHTTAFYNDPNQTKSEPHIPFSTSEGQFSNQFIHSSDGKYLLIQEKKQIIQVFDLERTIQSKKPIIIGQATYQNVQNVSISEGEQYCLIMDKLAVESYKLNILAFPSLELIETRDYKRYKKELWPLIKFVNKDRQMVTILNQTLIISEVLTKKQIYSLDVGSSEYFCCQPEMNNFLIACWALKKELTVGSTGFLRLYNPSKTALPIFEREVPNANEIDLKWSPNGQTLLMVKSSGNDLVNHCYYGASDLFIYDFQKRDFIQIPTYEGPVHAVEWAPDSECFIAITGLMPAGAVLFNKDGKPKFEFGKDHKNTVYWSPLKRFVLICGFGNLDGSVDVWDTFQLKVVGRCKEKSASLCTWSPCGRKFILAKVTPRMNVDNLFKVFDYQGCILYEQYYDSELYAVKFLPVPKGIFTDRLPSPPRNTQLQQATQQKKIFVPVGGSGQLAEQLRQMKTGEGSRFVQSNETFGNNQQTGWGLQRSNQPTEKKLILPPGCAPPPEKKEKKKRVRKLKGEKDDEQN